jgi:hypothetical protein
VKFFVVIILVLFLTGLWFNQDNEQALAVHSEARSEARGENKKSKKLMPLGNHSKKPDRQLHGSDSQGYQKNHNESSPGSYPQSHVYQGTHTETPYYEQTQYYLNEESSGGDESGSYQAGPDDIADYSPANNGDDNQYVASQDAVNEDQGMMNAGEDFFVDDEGRDPANE